MYVDLRYSSLVKGLAGLATVPHVIEVEGECRGKDINFRVFVGGFRRETKNCATGNRDTLVAKVLEYGFNRISLLNKKA